MHLRIAEERRRTELAIYRVFRTIHLRFRDIGGSRTRWHDFAELKHACLPQIDSSDILRDGKEPEPLFDLCRELGQNCPKKDTFPGALLMHVDYYMDAEDLARCVRSHTFFCTHRFEGSGGELHGEMKWERRGPYIFAYTADGTRYKHHYHYWQAEGCVVGKTSAFSYIRVWRGPTMDVYYAFPIDGVYRSDDPQRLRSSREVVVRPMTRGLFAVQEEESYMFYNSDWDIVFTVPVDALQRVASRCGTGSRDQKYCPPTYARSERT